VSPARERALRVGLRGLALGLGVLAAFAGRNAINADGISYLDIGDAYARGDWRGALSAYWSPLYSWLLGGALAALGPSAYWEFPVVHLVNLVLFAVALVCFEVFLRALRGWCDAVAGGPAAAGPADWTWRLWGYAVFLPASLWMVTLGLVTPDLLVLGAVLLTAALLARIAAGRASVTTFVALGLVLGVGYLAKLAMLPIAVVTFALLSIMSLRRIDVARGAAIALAGFALVGLPWIAVLSTGLGRLSVGESAGLNYGWIVNRPEGQRIETGLTAFGAHEGLAHPPVQLLAAPAVYEFDGGVPGTLPLWRDPGYWHEGAATHFSLSRQARAVLANLQRLGRLAIGWAPCLLGLAVLAVVGRRHVRAWRWPLFVLALAGVPLAMYVAIHIEYRYIGALVVLLLMAAFAAMRGPDTQQARRLTAAVVTVVFVAQVTPVAATIAYDTAHEVKGLIRLDPLIHRHWQIARGLQALGLRPGDRVAVAGDFFTAGWARLARLRVTAAVEPGVATDHRAGADARLDAALARAGVRAIVAEGEPLDDGVWTRLGDRHTWARLVADGAHPAPQARVR
jgi:hypothetical protein